MPAQGRRNVHGKTGVRFKAAYTKSKRENMLRNVVSELIIHEHITVTSGVVQEVISETERLVTLTKKEDKLNAKRQAASYLRKIYADKEQKVSALDKLFDVLGPRYESRNGGYLTTYKVENRRGDNAQKVIIAFVK